MKFNNAVCKPSIMDAICTEKLILLVEANPVLFNKFSAGYKDALKKGDIWRQIGAAIGVSGERCIVAIRYL